MNNMLLTRAARIAATREADAVATSERARLGDATPTRPITSDPIAGIDADFNSPFSAERLAPFSGRVSCDTKRPLPPLAVVETRGASTSTPSVVTEPFEHRYLDALSDEGIDLPSFLEGWRRAMNDDLARLSVLQHIQGHPDRLRALLHRLSGAAGLVGALGLMEALRRASASPLEQNAGSISALIVRTKSLIRQLETPPVAHRKAQL
jgi:hypothetical protein